MPGLSTFLAVTNSLTRNGAAPVALSLSGEWPSLPPSKVIEVSVLSRGRVSFSGSQGFTFVAARCLYTPAIPPPCGVDSAEFSFVMKPMNRLSVLRLRTIDEDFRIWTSPAPVDFYRPSGKERVFHICEQAPGNPVREVRVDGGSVALVNGFGRGETTYGSAISASREAPPSPYAFATIPLQTIPMYAGFELTLKVRPTDVSRPAWNTVKVFFDQHEAWIEVNGTRGERKQFSGWQFGPTIGGLGVMPWKTDYYPGEFGALSVRLR